MLSSGGSVRQRAALDRLLANELQVARRQLHRVYDAGMLIVSPAQRDALRKRVRDGQCVRLLEVISDSAVVNGRMSSVRVRSC